MVKDAQELVKKEAESLKKYEDQQEDAKKVLAAKDAEVEKQAKVVETLVAKVVAAKKKLNKAIADKDPQDTIDLMEVVVNDATSKRNAAKEKLGVVNRERIAQQVEIDQTQEVVKGLSQGVKAKWAKAEEAEKKLESMNNDHKKTKQEADAIKEKASSLEKVVAETRAKITENMASMEKMQKSVQAARTHMAEEEAADKEATDKDLAATKVKAE